MSAVAITIGSRLIGSGDYTTPFLIMVACILISTVIYWRVFRPVEISKIREQIVAATLQPSSATPH